MLDLPKVEHIYQNHHMDTTRWNYFTPRDDDIIIATSYKAGTTFTQTIVGNLLFPNDDLPGPASFISPWLDMRVFPLELVLNQLEAQTHRRYIKTHLPLDGLPFHQNLKYICVTRDPRDVFMSMLNHWGNHTPEFYMAMNGIPGLVGDPFPEFVDDTKTTWRNWVTKGWFDWHEDGFPYWSHFTYALTFWKYRHLPNIKLIHFNDLLADLDGEMHGIAEYLDIDVPDELWADVVKRCTFKEVKKDPSKVVGANIDFGFKGGANTFIYKGTNGRWQGVLDDEDLALYDEAMAKLPPDYAHWLQNGGPTD
ncbi:MAG: sulfotransferase domain-containing protein [Alphaproteobacteria bacterium]|nr:MAG: sulfotransferase domain-containing protein [Alphaproteobacteria bacterium]